MATKLYLRNTTTNGISGYYDMVTTAGAGAATVTATTTTGGTEIQYTNGQWISGRVPSGGFTLTTTDVDAWLQQSNAKANTGGRYRVFKRAVDGTITELGGGPFNDGVEPNTSATSMTWAGNVTDTAFAENERIIVRFYVTNVGTMGNGYTCTMTFNAADGSTGDSFFNIAETVAFKAEAVNVNTTTTVLGGTFSIQEPTVTGVRNVDTTTTVLNLTSSIQEPTVTAVSSTSINVSATELTGTFSIVATTVTTQVNLNYTTEVLNGLFTILEPTITAIRNSNVDTVTIDATFNANDVTVSTVTGVDIQSEVVNILSSVLDPTVSTVRNLDTTTDTLEITSTVNDPTVSTVRNVNIDADLINGTFTIETPTIVIYVRKTLIRNATLKNTTIK